MPLASFDNYAHKYDAHFTFSPVGILQRQMVYLHLFPILTKESNVLELNCGTGYDAFNIAKIVNSILAIDASKKMIEQCLKKNEEYNYNTIHFEVKQIETLQEDLKNKTIIFSNFGGLNCLSPKNLETFATKCKTLSFKDTDLIFVIMGRKCAWERFYFLLKLDLKKAFRRQQKKGIETCIDDSNFLTWYYSPAEIAQLFEPTFKTQKITGIGLFVPPSYLNPFFANKTGLLKFFYWLDKLICKFRWTANYADHYLIHLKKIE